MDFQQKLHNSAIFRIFLLQNYMEASSINTLNNQQKIVNIFIRLVKKKLLNFSLFFYLSGGYAPLRSYIGFKWKKKHIFYNFFLTY